MARENTLADIDEIASPTKISDPQKGGQFFMDLMHLTKEERREIDNRNQKKEKNDTSEAKDIKAKLDYENLKPFGHHVMRRAGDNKRLLEVIGDMNSLVKIIVSGTISPNTLERGNMMYNIAPESTMEEAVRNALMHLMETYYDERYEVTTEMEHDIKEMLAGSGSVFRMILPPDQIQAMIHNNTEISMEDMGRSLESMADKTHWGLGEFVPKQLGVFGTKDSHDGTEWSMENLYGGTAGKGDVTCPVANGKDTLFGVDVLAIDNPTYLRNEYLQEHIASKAYEARLRAIQGDYATSWSMEGINGNQYEEGKKNTFRLPVRTLKLKKDGKSVTEIGELEELDLEGLGIEESKVEYLDHLPAYLKTLPPESVIVLHRKGKPTQVMGYIVLLEKGGHPLSLDYDESIERVRTHRITENTKGSGSIIKRIRDDLYADKEEKEKEYSLDDSHTMILDYFKERMVKFTTETLENGLFGKLIDFRASDEMVLNAFFAAMDDKGLRMVFVPESQMQHFAFDYDEYGLGKTMFDDARTLFNMKAALLYSQVYAAITSARPVKDVTIKIDPDDKNPRRTALKRVEEVLRAEGNAMPWSDISKGSLERAVLYSGMNIKFEGNDNLPQSSTEVREGRREAAQIDESTRDLLNEMCYQSTGWSPEVVEWFKDAELATSIISNNLQVSRRIHFYQTIFLRHHKSMAEKLIPVDGEFLHRLVFELSRTPAGKKYLKSLAKSAEEQIGALKEKLPELIEDITFELPRPDTSVMKAKREEMESFISMLDVMMEGYMSEDFFDASDEMRTQARAFKAQIRAGCIRWYNERNDIVPELGGLFDKDGNSPLASDHNEFIDRLGEKVISIMKQIKKKDFKATRTMDDLEERERNRGAEPEPAPVTEETPAEGEDDNPFGSEEPESEPTAEDEPSSDEPSEEEAPEGGDEPEDEKDPFED